MKYYTEIIPVSLAEKLKERGMPMILWQIGNNTDYVEVIETRQEIFDESKTYEVGVRYNLPTYGDCFDWLMEKGLSCEITRHIDFAYEEVCPEWDWDIEKVGTLRDCPQGYGNTWHEAANAAIEKALTLI